uniref:Uncharacterized protein n=1 Tax=Ditylum brightwellii TaxID=49249 RepID=A0A7S4R704_9STRA
MVCKFRISQKKHQRQSSAAVAFVAVAILVCVGTPVASFSTRAATSSLVFLYNKKSTATLTCLCSKKNEQDGAYQSFSAAIIDEEYKPKSNLALDNSLSSAGEQTSNTNTENEQALLLQVWNTLLNTKEELYQKIRQLFIDLYTIIQRSTRKGGAWIRQDETGQLVSSALALVAFYAVVATFAVWSIEMMGGKKFSGPTQGVTVPTLVLPDTSSSSGGAKGSIQFQKPKWKVPKITTSYSSHVTDVPSDDS